MIHPDRPTTNTERMRRFHDKDVSIDAEFEQALASIDWERRKEAERSLVTWTKTYCMGLLLDDDPPQNGCQILSEMQRAIVSHSNYMILMGRGQGKTSYEEATTLYALATGLQKFVVVISNNSRAAGGILQDIWRCIVEPDTPFSQDYPEVCFPFQTCHGSYKRRQLYNGQPTELQKTSQVISLARLKDKNTGKELATSGSLITVRGIGSGLRGMKKNTLRPSLVLLDDLQDSDSASSPEQVEKLLQLIRKDIMSLGGKQRLSILQTATPICQQDLVEKLKDDVSWKTTTYPVIISYPKRKDMWEQYFKLWDAEAIADSGHEGSLDFYKQNFDQMNDGAEVFNPSRYSTTDGHISAIQKMLEMKHMIGDAAFDAEFQMKPHKFAVSLDISPKQVATKLAKTKKLEIPDGYVFLAASTDLNVSYALTTTLVAFRPDMTAVVIGHFLTKVRIDSKLPQAEYNSRVYEALAKLGSKLKGLGLKIDGWGIDANGVPFDAVTDFCKASTQVCGIPACAMIGKASHMFNGYVRSRLRDEINRTVLCGDAQEHLKSGSGRRWLFWDSDLHRELCQKAFLAEVGSVGSCQLYNAPIDEHTEYANQLCNEKLVYVKHGQDGRNMYNWASREPHDYLDSTAQAFAVASSQGLSGSKFSRKQATAMRVARPSLRGKPTRPRVKFV